MEQGTIAAPSADVYYKKGYWNEYPEVLAEINRRISGSPERSYLDVFAEQILHRRFARALFVNCGNGWVERDFFTKGLLDEAVGVDYSDDLLEQARAANAHLPIRYERLDINDAVFPDARYDLIVNYSAGHHIAYVDRVLRALAGVLTDDGWFVNYDYIGPHRNQYPYEQWSAVWEFNQTLPEGARQVLSYPHLPTMLATDPSEAIHSELFVETFRRYFKVVDFRRVGGALAYPLLTFNSALQTLSDEERRAVVESILRADEEFVRRHPDSTLFAYWCGTPDKRVLSDSTLLARWTREEAAREEAAASNGGRYYRRSLLEALIYPEDERTT